MKNFEAYDKFFPDEKNNFKNLRKIISKYKRNSLKPTTDVEEKAVDVDQSCIC